MALVGPPPLLIVKAVMTIDGHKARGLTAQPKAWHFGLAQAQHDMTGVVPRLPHGTLGRHGTMGRHGHAQYPPAHWAGMAMPGTKFRDA